MLCVSCPPQADLWFHFLSYFFMKLLKLPNLDQRRKLCFCFLSMRYLRCVIRLLSPIVYHLLHCVRRERAIAPGQKNFKLANLSDSHRKGIQFHPWGTCPLICMMKNQLLRGILIVYNPGIQKSRKKGENILSFRALILWIHLLIQSGGALWA